MGHRNKQPFNPLNSMHTWPEMLVRERRIAAQRLIAGLFILGDEQLWSRMQQAIPGVDRSRFSREHMLLSLSQSILDRLFPTDARL